MCCLCDILKYLKYSLVCYYFLIIIIYKENKIIYKSFGRLSYYFYVVYFDINWYKKYVDGICLL